jgi:hypothetical protein
MIKENIVKFKEIMKNLMFIWKGIYIKLCNNLIVPISISHLSIKNDSKQC